MLNILEAKFPVFDVKVELNVDTQVNQKADDLYECMICVENIVWDGKSCVGDDGCERLFCGKCILTWTDKS